MTACIEWQGARQPKGYGVVGKRGAHRVMYELVYGPIPEGAHILHSCDNPPCVNPLHLRAGSNAQNQAEKAARGRARNQFSDATTCVKGHPFDSHDGRQKVCLSCKRERGLAYYHRTKGRAT
jgi:hypothetical protein